MPAARSEAENAAAEAYEASRTAEEKEGFGKALHETMDLWYAHQGTTVYMLTVLPEGCARKVSYDDSGWTTYERCSAEQIKKVFLTGGAEWKLVLDLGTADPGEQTAARRWPVGPDDFDKLIKAKQFTNGADEAAVAKLFRKMSKKQLGGVKELRFQGLAAPSVADMRGLGGCLNLCASLQTLTLVNLGMSDAACEALFSTLASGALPSSDPSPEAARRCLPGSAHARRHWRRRTMTASA